MIFFPCAELALIRGQITGMKSIPQCDGLSRAINTTVQMWRSRRRKEWQERICRIEGRVWMIAHLPLLLGRTVGYVSILCTKKTMPIRVLGLLALSGKFRNGL